MLIAALPSCVITVAWTHTSGEVYLFLFLFPFFVSRCSSSGESHGGSVTFRRAHSHANEKPGCQVMNPGPISHHCSARRDAERADSRIDCTQMENNEEYWQDERDAGRAAPRLRWQQDAGDCLRGRSDADQRDEGGFISSSRAPASVCRLQRDAASSPRSAVTLSIRAAFINLSAAAAAAQERRDLDLSEEEKNGEGFFRPPSLS